MVRKPFVTAETLYECDTVIYSFANLADVRVKESNKC